jgi:mono/diheme cytochrome c family protein
VLCVPRGIIGREKQITGVSRSLRRELNMSNMIPFLLLIAAAVFLAWLTNRARRIHHRPGKWSAVSAAAVLTVIAWSLCALTLAGMIKQHNRTAPVPTVKIAATPEQVRHGEALAAGFCGSCHSQFGPMVGGKDLGKDLAVPVGSFVATNLTPAGALRQWSDGEIFRAIRNGVDAHGNWLTIMSYTNAGQLSDADTYCLIAYIRSLPAAGQPTVDPPDHFNLLGLAMLGAGVLPTGNPIFTGVITAPPKSATARYGEYILSYEDCRACHGATLSGGVPGQMAPLGPNLAFVKTWKVEQFITAMRTGVDPNGHVISEAMPWRTVGKMDDEELTAIYDYLVRSRDSLLSATKTNKGSQ